MTDTIEFADGTIGIDTTIPLTANACSALVRDGVQFVFRYLSRAAYANPSDITREEARLIRLHGLALGLVQHVKSESRWTPYATEGLKNGASARLQLWRLGAPRGVTIALDLEAVYANDTEVVRYVNSWNTEIEISGYGAGLYLGDHDGLNASQAYHRLTSRRYWAAYNLNLDEYPAKRGVCVRQREASNYPAILYTSAGCDVNVTHTDALGGRWAFWAPEPTP